MTWFFAPPTRVALFITVLDRHVKVFTGVPFTAHDLPTVARHAFDQARVNPGVFRLLARATLENPAAAMPGAGLSPETVRDWIADMTGRIAGQN